METYFAPAGRDTPEELQRRATLVQNTPLLQMIMDALPAAVVILNENRQILAIAGARRLELGVSCLFLTIYKSNNLPRPSRGTAAGEQRPIFRLEGRPFQRTIRPLIASMKPLPIVNRIEDRGRSAYHGIGRIGLRSGALGWRREGRKQISVWGRLAVWGR